MLCSSTLAASMAALMLSLPVDATLYTKDSPVLQVTGKTFDRHVIKSNHTSIIEFYAPWCGHCQKLAPAYEKAAKTLKGLAKVVGVNCDADANKAFCGTMGVKGFPTLKIVRPSRRGGKPSFEEYSGDRSAKAIVDAVVERIPNHVKRLTDVSLESWLKEKNDTAKAILFTEKSTVSALLRSLAIDYLGSVSFAQIRNKEKATVEEFGIEKFPAFVLLTGGKESVLYDGEMKRADMSDFLLQVATPNPDPAPEKEKKKEDKKATKKEEKPKKEQKTESEEPKPAAPPKEKKTGPIIPVVDEPTLREKCLTDTSKVCALVLLPSPTSSKAPLPQEVLDALKSLGQVYEKHSNRQAAFPFYIVESQNPLAKSLREELGLKSAKELDTIAINAKRLWWRKYTGESYSYVDVEAWVDAIRMNEGKREKLPQSLVTMTPDEDEDEDAGSAPKAKEEEKKPEVKETHDEL